MKIIQMATLPEAAGTLATLFLLTDEGQVFYASLDPTGKKTAWQQLNTPFLAATLSFQGVKGLD
jgi:hypothetical protein